MLTELVAFCAGAAAALTTTRAALRRFVREQASEQRWQALVDAAGYGPASTPTASPAPRSVERPAAGGCSPGGRGPALSAVAITAAVTQRPAPPRRRIQIRVRP